MEKQNLPLVSIICTAYNHESFINQCLEGFIFQKTLFPFEIIVHDDASTDNTKSIILEYELKNPNLFNNIYQTKNQFSNKKVGIWTDIMFPKARGKYLAICEGDDFWTDPLKLQKQIDFLESNPDYSMSFHGVSELNGDIYNDDYNKTFDGKTTRTFEDFLTGSGFFPRTCTTVIRNSPVIIGLMSKIDFKVFTDLSLKLIPSFIGKAKYLPDTMAVYRIHNSSMMAQYKKDSYFRDQITEINELINLFKPDKRIKYLINLRNTYQFQLAGYEILQKNIKGGFTTFFSAVFYLRHGIRSKKVLLFFPGILIYRLMPSIIKKTILWILNIKNPIYKNAI